MIEPTYRRLRLTSALAFAICSFFVASQTDARQSDTNADRDLTPDKQQVFKHIDNSELKLHIFEPASHLESDRRPVVIFFFGGGWKSGTPKQFYQQARFLADHGVLAISAEYRVKNRDNATPFQCVSDAKSAIRWVREHSIDLGVNPDQIVAAGGSAGGHIAACTGLIEGLDESNENRSVSSLPNAMILFNPVLDTTRQGYGHNNFAENRRTDISPCHHVRSGNAPTLLFHGKADKTVPHENALRFTKLMTEAGNRCDLHSFKDKGHGFFNGPAFRPKLRDTSTYDKTMQESLAFLRSLGYLE